MGAGSIAEIKLSAFMGVIERAKALTETAMASREPATMDAGRHRAIEILNEYLRNPDASYPADAQTCNTCHVRAKVRTNDGLTCMNCGHPS